MFGLHGITSAGAALMRKAVTDDIAANEHA